jgi:hypothetical protein
VRLMMTSQQEIFWLNQYLNSNVQIVHSLRSIFQYYSTYIEF